MIYKQDLFMDRPTPLIYEFLWQGHFRKDRQGLWNIPTVLKACFNQPKCMNSSVFDLF